MAARGGARAYNGPVPKNPYEWLYAREAQPLKAYVLDAVAERLAAAVKGRGADDVRHSNV